MNSHPSIDEEAVAAADKEMEERANRAKELLSQRYDGIRAQQVCNHVVFFCTFLFETHFSSHAVGGEALSENSSRTTNDWSAGR